LDKAELEQIELNLLLQAISERYGYTFAQYSQVSIKRLVMHHLTKSSLQTIADLIPKILYDEKAFEALFFDISVTVTEMFRDPWFYLALREQVMPFLKTYPYIKVWHAGCATGEEVYSMAIVLQEEGLYERVHIYATDFNHAALKKAQSRTYPLERVDEYDENYHRAGGKTSLADYYLTKHQSMIINRSLQRNITFAHHNLVTDGVFGEMHLIICRNVLIYFNRDLQNRVLSLLRDSVCYNGFLCLGSQETIHFSNIHHDFVEVAAKEKIYQCKKKGVGCKNLVHKGAAGKLN
jgi:chemotaxis protein methyltransferase CheR